MQTVTLLRATKSVSKSLRVPSVTRCFPTRCHAFYTRAAPIRSAICLPGREGRKGLRRPPIVAWTLSPIESSFTFLLSFRLYLFAISPLFIVRQISFRGSWQMFRSIDNVNCLSFAKICASRSNE